MDDGDALGINRSRALQKRQGRQGLEIGGTLVEVLRVGIGGHGTKPSKACARSGPASEGNLVDPPPPIQPQPREHAPERLDPATARPARGNFANCAQLRAIK